MKLSVSKLAASQAHEQCDRLQRVLLFAGAADLRIACTARVSVLEAGSISSPFTDRDDWVREVSGPCSAAGLLAEFERGAVFEAQQKAPAMRLDISPEPERPLQGWDGRWDGSFRLLITRKLRDEAAMSLGTVLDQLGYPQTLTECYTDGTCSIVHGFQRLRRTQVCAVWRAVLEAGCFSALCDSHAAYISELRSLTQPGFVGVFSPPAAAADTVQFGPLASLLKCPNMTTSEAREFTGSIVARLERRSTLTLQREFLQWPSAKGVRIRGSLGNAVRLNLDHRASELTVEFERFADDDPTTSELKRVFLEYWSKNQGG